MIPTGPSRYLNNEHDLCQREMPGSSTLRKVSRNLGRRRCAQSFLPGSSLPQFLRACDREDLKRRSASPWRVNKARRTARRSAIIVCRASRASAIT